jgi:pyruvate kinase
MRRAKIICTLGPASDPPGAIRSLIEAGMDVARLNFSHGAYDEHARRLESVRAASWELGKPVAILQDLCGPKVRSGEGGPASLATGDTIRLAPGSRGDNDTLAVDYERLVHSVGVGDRILLSDGAIELRVESVERDALRCRVEHGGALRSRMGVNLPSGKLELPAITEKDRADLKFGLEAGVDLVALSFVRTARDVVELRELCAEAALPPRLIAKIETPGAVDAIDEIAQVTDGVMVARGDLGVELPPASVPPLQKRIIDACRAQRRPVIVATEMLQSMVHASRPTRAEANDVAGAVFDGADATMLSAETAVGENPSRACATMASIIAEAEASPYAAPRPSPSSGTPADSVAKAACTVAQETGARCIVALTQSGRTGRLISCARPRVPVLALSPNEHTLDRLAVCWGIVPRYLEFESDTERLIRRTREYVRESGFAKPGERFVVIFGSPGSPGDATNSIRVEEAS